MPVCLTVFADASFDPRSGIAAFAGWFRMAGRIYKVSKVSKRRFASSNEAELVALCATVLVALSRQRFSEGDFVVAKSDCTYAVDHLQSRTGGTTETERRMVVRVHDILKDHGLGFYVRHVKGHTTRSEPRFYVNRWCDEEARRLMRRAVRQDTGQQSEKK